MRRLDRVLEHALDQREIVKAAQAWQGLNRWPEVVGENLAQRSWPDRFEHGTVYVAVTGSAWAQELRMQKPLILGRLGSLLGNRALVQDVRFGVRALPERAFSERASGIRRQASGEELGFQELKERILSQAKSRSSQPLPQISGFVRHELSRRPSLLIAGSLICGLVAIQHWPIALFVLPLVWLPAELIWRIAVSAFFAVGLFLAPERASQVNSILPFHAECRVASIPDISSKGQLLTVVSGTQAYSMYWRDKTVLAPGDRLEVTGEIEPLGDYPTRGRDELTLSGQVRPELGGVRLIERGPVFYLPSVLWRASFVKFVRQDAQLQASAVVNALCFNVTADLDQKTYQNLQRTGTVHIVSASGLHVFIFGAGLSLVLGLLPVPRGWRLLLIGLVLSFYAMGAGMKPPVVRSVVMAAILGGATLLRKEPDLLSALGATAVAYLFLRPEAVYDLGFQFSFVTVAGLGMFLKLPDQIPTQPLSRLWFSLIEVSKASLVATIASAPLSAFYFGAVSIVSIPANVLIALSLPPITLTAFAAHALSGMFPALSAGMMFIVVDSLSGWVLWVAETLGNLSFSTITVPTFSAYWMIPYYIGFLMIWRPRARPV